MTAQELRQKYLDFFKTKGHAIIPSASLIPENDPTVLFTTAGMHPLVPYIMGEVHPEGKRLADSQKCIRTTDIEDVGDNRHLTFFEMLGNWSLGDYFKKEAIEWSWEFLTDKRWLGLDPNRFYVTVFMGNENSLVDQESIDIWKEQFKKSGIEAEICDYNSPIGGDEKFRIFPLPAKDNWWGPAGETGPCGPCTEMFYDVSPEKGVMQKTFDEEVNDFRIMEVWNDVFMEFNKNSGGVFEKMKQQNVDTGMGLERTLAVLTGKQDAFDIELFHPLLEKIEELSGKKYSDSEEIKKSMRIIADHIKAATFIMGDDKGVSPSNTDQGYIVRRMIRRAINHGRQLGINKKLWTQEISQIVISQYKSFYAELENNSERLIQELNKEEEKFSKTLEKGLREFEKIKSIDGITGFEAFDLYQTYGFPIEMTKEIAGKENIPVDEKGFQAELKKHQNLSRTASAGKFKGGLADSGEETKKLHTAAHLLLAALRKVLGDHVHQKGSNINPERLRLDFSHPEKLNDDQRKEIERLVNEAIENKLPIVQEEMTVDEARKQGAEGVFESKYGEKVKVYSAGDFSKEICGGPHAENTGELGNFRIKKEESSSAGVRRIKAVLE